MARPQPSDAGRAAVPRQRARLFVDYSLQRRAAVLAIRSGQVDAAEHCDPHPDLRRAARHHGERAGRRCPLCRRQALVYLRYAYSPELGQYSGRLRTAGEVVQLGESYGEVRMFVVEVCTGCWWNHLAASYVVGDGVPRRPPRRRHTVEDDWG